MTTVKTEIGVHRRQAHHTEFAPTGNISATDVQSAIEEVLTDSAPSDATYYVTSSNASLSAEVVVPAFMQSVLDDTTAADARTTLGAQTQGDVLDDLNTLGAAASDGEFIVATGAGAFAYESGSTVRASLGLTIGSDVQAWDAGLDDISGLAVTDGNIIVGDGANWVAESGATARTSLGLGTIATEAETNYALLAGRSGGQTLIGGTDASDDLVFNSTANATKGTIRLGDATTGLFFDETNSRLAIGEEEFAMTIAAGSVASRVAIHTEGGEAVAELHTHSTGLGLLSGPVVYGARSDGTAAAPTIVVDNDHLLTIAGLGYDGTDYAIGGYIIGRVNGTPGAGDMPMDWEFWTTPDGAEVPIMRAVIRESGAIDVIAGPLNLPNTGLHLLDTGGDHDYIIAPGEDATADRTLTLDLNDADRTLDLTGNTTLAGGTHSGTNTGDEVSATEGTEGVLDKATDAEIRAATSGAHAICAEDLSSANALVTLTDAATIAIDWTSGINFTVTLTTDRILGNPTNEIPGTWRTVFVISDGGPDTLTFGSEYGGTPPTITDITTTQAYLLNIYCRAAGQFLVFSADGSPA